MVEYEWDPAKVAAALLHLAIDAFIYLEQGKPVLGGSTGKTTVAQWAAHAWNAGDERGG